MSQDIRSFFSVVSKKSGTDSAKTVPSPNKKKKTKRLIDSDDEDIISSTPDQKTTKVQKKRKVKVILSSDSEDDTTKKKPAKPGKKPSSPDKKTKTPTKTKTKPSQPKLKPASIEDVFKNVPIKQSKVEPPPKQPELKVEEKEMKKSKSKKKTDREKEKKVHDDKDFEKTLEVLDLDDELFERSVIENMDMLEETEALLKNDGKKEIGNSENHNNENSKKASTGDITKENISDSDNQEIKGSRKRTRTDSSDKNTPKKKKFEHTDSGIDPGQEAHEKKRYSAMLYQKYLNRSGPAHQGMKEYPKGKPDCLKNLCFLKTGVLDSLESAEFDNLIKQHGGRVVSGVSKKVNFLVVGEDPGPSKLAKADTLQIPNISEDELLDMILTKSGMQPRYCTKNTSGYSEDLGIESDTEDKTALTEKENEQKKDSAEEIKIEKTVKESPKKKSEGNKEKKHSENEKKKIEINTNKDSGESSKISNKGQNGSINSSSFYKQSNEISPQENTQSLTQPPASKHIKSDFSNMSLTEKYKPQTLKAIIGQQGDSSNVNKLKKWLENWHKNQNPKVKKSLIKPSPWAKCDDGAYFKCALLSGSPGVGKTTTATLVSKELGLDIVEFNASDTRSKKLLHEEVAQLLSSKTIAGFATGQSNLNNRRVLLMDEVDGMAGNEDRGGIQELIQLIKTTSVPIICMCNDRNHQKMRSLVNYCFDLKFAKPRLEQIRGAMMSICFKEKIEIAPQALAEIIAGTGCDVRQSLNHLALLGSTNQKITTEVAEKEAKASKKDTVRGPWEVCRTVFTKSEHEGMSVADKARLFFFDYSLGPLFVQENYLKVQPSVRDKKQCLLRAALSADSISMGDLIDSKIRRSNNWSLLESEAFFSSVLPGHYMSGTFTGQINFPAWLGKNSKKNKFNRLLSEIQSHTRTSASASKLAIKLDYLVPLRDKITLPLKKKGMEGIDDAISVMKAYNLLREDVDSLVELCQWSKGENPMNGIDTKVKTAFTRTYNKRVTLLPYAPTSGVAKKKAAARDNNPLAEEEGEMVSDNEEDDISDNAMIKLKKKPAARGKKMEEGPSTSKKSETKKGKGKKK